MSVVLENPRLREAVEELRRRAAVQGFNVMVTSGDRSPAEQARLYAGRSRNPYPVAPPGTSGHERRVAVDLNVWRKSDGAKLSPHVIADLAKQVGLVHAGEVDPVHFRLAGATAARVVKRRKPATVTRTAASDELAEALLAEQAAGEETLPVGAVEEPEPEPEPVAAAPVMPLEAAAPAEVPAVPEEQPEAALPEVEAEPELQASAGAEDELADLALQQYRAGKLKPAAAPVRKAPVAPVRPTTPPPAARTKPGAGAPVKAAAPVAGARGVITDPAQIAAVTELARTPPARQQDPPAAKQGLIPTIAQAGHLLQNLPTLFDPLGEGQRGDLSKLKVLQVLDGDTFDVLLNGRALRVRLHAVDAPEKIQPFGAQSRGFTESTIGKGRVQVRQVDRDKYGRTIGSVLTSEGRSLNLDLTRNGLAWWYRSFGANEQEVAQAEAAARAERKGLWSQEHPQAPWEFRKKGGPLAPKAGSREEAQTVAAGTIDPQTLTVRKAPGLGDKVGRFVRSLALGRTVDVEDAAAAAVRRLELAGEIPAPHFAAEPAQRAQQERRLAQLRMAVEAYDRQLDQVAVNAVAKLPYAPPPDPPGLGAPDGPNDPRYAARDARLNGYRARYRGQVEAAYGQQREHWNWQELGPFLKERLGELSDWDRQAIDGAIRAKRTEWKFRPGLNAAVGADILQGMTDLLGGEVTGPMVAHFAGPPLKALGRTVGKTVAGLTEGWLARLPREVRYLVQTAPKYLEHLGSGGNELSRDLRRLNGEILKKTARTGATGDDLVQLRRHEAVRLWGEGLERAERAIARIAKERSPAEAERVRRFLRYDIMGDNAYAPQTVAPGLARGLSTYETLTKLGGRPTTVLRNWTQRFTNSSLEYGFTPVLRAQLELVAKPWRTASQLLWREAERAGVFVGETAADEGKLTGKVSRALLSGFDRVEQGNRFVAARVKQLGVERDLQLLAQLQTENPAVTRLKQVLTLGARAEGAATRRLGRAGISAARVRSLVASGGRLTEEEMIGAMQAAARDEQFAMDLLGSPMWWKNSPWLRAMGKFKPFAVKQLGLVWNVAVKEAGQGNYAPLARYLGASMAAGELYNSARDLAFGGDRTVSSQLLHQKQDAEGERKAQEIGKRLLRNFADGGGLGLVTDLMLGQGADDQWDKTADLLLKGRAAEAFDEARGVAGEKVPQLVGGPVAGTIKNVGKAVLPGAKADPPRKRALDLLKKEVPVVKDALAVERRIRGKKKPDDLYQEQAEKAERAR